MYWGTTISLPLCVVFDKNLSDGALGLLIRIYSGPNRKYTKRALMAHRDIKRSRLDTLIHELIDAGYCVKTPEKLYAFPITNDFITIKHG